MQPLKSTKRLILNSYYKTIRFFHNKYTNVIERFTNYLMSTSIRMMYYLMFLKGKNIDHVQSLALNFAQLTGSLMKDLIVLQGKDPNYVFPPPPPPPAPEVLTPTEQMAKRIHAERERAYQAFSTGIIIPKWNSSYFKTANHPGYVARMSLEAKAAPAVSDKEQVTEAPVEEIQLKSTKSKKKLVKKG